MPVPSTIADLSTVAADNSPQGSEPIGTSLDNYIRAGYAFIKQVYNALPSFPLAVASGGTGATTAAGARTNLGLGSAATLTAGTEANNVIQLDALAKLPAVDGIVPAGTVIFTASSSVPKGFIKANGALVSRTAYAALFSAIGTTFGAGDGSTTFSLPDLRGEFLRGWDDGRGIDSGRTIGSYQADQLQNLTGSFTTTRGIGGSNTGTFSGSTGASATYSGPAGGTYATTIDFNAANSPGARTGSETRSRNVALLACIKY